MKNLYKFLQSTQLILLALFISGILLVPAVKVGAQVDKPNPVNVLDPVCKDDPLTGSEGQPDATLCRENENKQAHESNSIYGPNGILTKVARILSLIIGVAAIIMIIVGGLKYILSQGDTANVQSAKNTILYAVIGLAVASMAQAIIFFVANNL